MKITYIVALMIGTISVVSGGSLVKQLANAQDVSPFAVTDQAAVSHSGSSEFISSECSPALAKAESQLISAIDAVDVSGLNQTTTYENNDQILHLYALFTCYIEIVSQPPDEGGELFIASQERVQNSINQLFEAHQLRPLSSPATYLINYYSQVLTEVFIENSQAKAATITN